MLLKVGRPVKMANGKSREFVVPGSKPETQRAILIGALANGRSMITHDLRCRETGIMKRATQALGAVLHESKEQLAIDGGSLLTKARHEVAIINCEGSGLVARIFTVLGTLGTAPLIITGDHVLRGREMKPLSEALQRVTRSPEYLAERFHLPVLVRGGGLKGGEYELPGDVSSQFITALLLGAPLADSPVSIIVRGPVFSGSYLRQTIAAMKKGGIHVDYDDHLRWFRVPLGQYQPFSELITGDYTSASYFLAAAALFEGTTVLRNISEHSLQGERAIIPILEELGVSCSFDSTSGTLTVTTRRGSLRGNYEFDVRDCPNIVSTLAALGSYVNGVFRVIGASITRLHKSPRVEAMVSELRKTGVDINPLTRSGLVDGFEVRGRDGYEGGHVLSSWCDHRIFMALFVASLRHRSPNLIDGYHDVDCSFPDFLEQFVSNGADYDIVSSPALGDAAPWVENEKCGAKQLMDGRGGSR